MNAARYGRTVFPSGFSSHFKTGALKERQTDLGSWFDAFFLGTESQKLELVVSPFIQGVTLRFVEQMGQWMCS